MNNNNTSGNNSLRQFYATIISNMLISGTSLNAALNAEMSVSMLNAMQSNPNLFGERGSFGFKFFRSVFEFTK